MATKDELTDLHDDISKLKDLKDTLVKKTDDLTIQRRRLETEIAALSLRCDEVKDSLAEMKKEHAERISQTSAAIEKLRTDLEKEKASCAKERIQVNAEAEANLRLQRELTAALEKAQDVNRRALSQAKAQEDK